MASGERWTVRHVPRRIRHLRFGRRVGAGSGVVSLPGAGQGSAVEVRFGKERLGAVGLAGKVRFVSARQGEVRRSMAGKVGFGLVRLG